MSGIESAKAIAENTAKRMRRKEVATPQMTRDAYADHLEIQIAMILRTRLTVEQCKRISEIAYNAYQMGRLSGE